VHVVDKFQTAHSKISSGFSLPSITRPHRSDSGLLLHTARSSVVGPSVCRFVCLLVTFMHELCENC